MSLFSRLGAVIAVAVVLGFYAWTAWGSNSFPLSHGSYGDDYNALVHGFRKGHLYLDVPVDPAMLAAKNPYAPAVWRVHGWMADASYFGGHYYLYFGPVPALLLLLPYQWIAGDELWLGSAVFFFATAAFLAFATLWWRIRRTYFPGAGGVMSAFAVLALGLNPGLLACLRRPKMYELPIVCGVFCVGLLLHCVLAAVKTRRQPALWLAMAGVALALAVGSRPTLCFAGLAPAAAAVFLFRDKGWRPAVAFALVTAVGVALLVFYNHQRFGRWLEFGFSYQLTDPRASERRMLSVGFIPYNLSTYFLNGLRWTRFYPFYDIVPSRAAPPGYVQSEWVYGLAKYAPALWFVAAAVLLWRRLGLLAAILIGAWAGVLCFDLCFESSAIRYCADFVTPAMLTGAVGAAAWQSISGSDVKRRLVGAAWSAATAFTAVVAVIVSLPLYGSLIEHKGGGTMLAVARVLNLPSFWFERLVLNEHYGPRTVSRSLEPGQVLSAIDARVLVRRDSADKVRLGVTFSPADTIWSEPMPAAGRTHTISAAFGSLYPGIEHPYFLKHPFTLTDRCAYQLDVDGRTVLAGFRVLENGDAGRIRIAPGAAETSRNTFRARLDLAAQFAPRRLSWAVPPAGRWPLWSAGSDGLLVEVSAAGKGRYVWVSAGAATGFSPWFAVADGARVDTVCGADVLTPVGPSAAESTLLWIESDRLPLWRLTLHGRHRTLAAPAFGSAPAGLRDCARRFPTAVTVTMAAPRDLPQGPGDSLLLKLLLPPEENLLLREPLLEWGRAGEADAVTMLYYSDTNVRFAFDHWGVGPMVESLIAGDAYRDRVHEVLIRFAPGLGPRVEFDGRVVMDETQPMYVHSRSDAKIGENPLHMAGEDRFHGLVLLRRWLPSPR